MASQGPRNKSAVNFSRSQKGRTKVKASNSNDTQTNDNKPKSKKAQSDQIQSGSIATSKPSKNANKHDPLPPTPSRPRTNKNLNKHGSHSLSQSHSQSGSDSHNRNGTNSNNNSNNNGSNYKSKSSKHNSNNLGDNGNYGLSLNLIDQNSENNEESYVTYSDYDDDEDEAFIDTMIPLETPKQHKNSGKIKHISSNNSSGSLLYKKRKSAEMGMAMRNISKQLNNKKKMHRRGKSTNQAENEAKLKDINGDASNSPSSSNAGQSDQDSDDDILSFTNESTLIVFVQKARNLPPKDIMGTSDSYVVVTVGDTWQASNKITSLNPVWDASFQFLCKYCNYVIIDVFDSDRITNDDEMGRVIIPLSDFKKYKEFQWCRLLRKSGNHEDKLTGDIYVKLVFVGDEPSFINQTPQMNRLISFTRQMHLNAYILENDIPIKQLRPLSPPFAITAPSLTQRTNRTQSQTRGRSKPVPPPNQRAQSQTPSAKNSVDDEVKSTTSFDRIIKKQVNGHQDKELPPTPPIARANKLLSTEHEAIRSKSQVPMRKAPSSQCKNESNNSSSANSPNSPSSPSSPSKPLSFRRMPKVVHAKGNVSPSPYNKYGERRRKVSKDDTEYFNVAEDEIPRSPLFSSRTQRIRERAKKKKREKEKEKANEKEKEKDSSTDNDSNAKSKGKPKAKPIPINTQTITNSENGSKRVKIKTPKLGDLPPTPQTRSIARSVAVTNKETSESEESDQTPQASIAQSPLRGRAQTLVGAFLHTRKNLSLKDRSSNNTSNESNNSENAVQDSEAEFHKEMARIAREELSKKHRKEKKMKRKALFNDADSDDNTDNVEDLNVFGATVDDEDAKNNNKGKMNKSTKHKLTAKQKNINGISLPSSETTPVSAGDLVANTSNEENSINDNSKSKTKSKSKSKKMPQLGISSSAPSVDERDEMSTQGKKLPSLANFSRKHRGSHKSTGDSSSSSKSKKHSSTNIVVEDDDHNEQRKKSSIGDYIRPKSTTARSSRQKKGNKENESTKPAPISMKIKTNFNQNDKKYPITPLVLSSVDTGDGSPVPYDNRNHKMELTHTPRVIYEHEVVSAQSSVRSESSLPRDFLEVRGYRNYMVKLDTIPDADDNFYSYVRKIQASTTLSSSNQSSEHNLMEAIESSFAKNKDKEKNKEKEKEKEKEKDKGKNKKEKRDSNDETNFDFSDNSLSRVKCDPNKGRYIEYPIGQEQIELNLKSCHVFINGHRRRLRGDVILTNFRLLFRLRPYAFSTQIFFGMILKMKRAQKKILHTKANKTETNVGNLKQQSSDKYLSDGLETPDADGTHSDGLSPTTESTQNQAPSSSAFAIPANTPYSKPNELNVDKQPQSSHSAPGATPSTSRMTNLMTRINSELAKGVKLKPYKSASAMKTKQYRDLPENKIIAKTDVLKIICKDARTIEIVLPPSKMHFTGEDGDDDDIDDDDDDDNNNSEKKESSTLAENLFSGLKEGSKKILRKGNRIQNRKFSEQLNRKGSKYWTTNKNEYWDSKYNSDIDYKKNAIKLLELYIRLNDHLCNDRREGFVSTQFRKQKKENKEEKDDSDDTSNGKPRIDASKSKLKARQILKNELLNSKRKIGDACWHVFDWVAEISRQGTSFEIWRPCDINNDFSVCPTYPQIFFVPKTCDDELVKQAAQFRSKGRLPILSWFNVKNGNAIVRCAQPNAGVLGKKSDSDKKYMDLIRRTCGDKGQLVFFDARSQAAANANRFRGHGTESSSWYDNMEIRFLNIGNIHTMRKSYDQLCIILSNPNFTLRNEDHVSAIFQTGWPKHIQLVLKGALQVAKQIMSEQASVAVVHCSDGWDRTSQLSALAQVLMDPFTRTKNGFIMILEKEWLQVGHKFEHRNGLSEKPNERSPILFQFLECVWQVLKMYPSEFEFTSQFLVRIADHSMSNWFGNFLYNCENERRANKIEDTSVSLWSWPIDSNPNYAPKQEFLRPPVSDGQMKVCFHDYFLRYHHLFDDNLGFSSHKPTLEESQTFHTASYAPSHVPNNSLSTFSQSETNMSMHSIAGLSTIGTGPSHFIPFHLSQLDMTQLSAGGSGGGGGGGSGMSGIAGGATIGNGQLILTNHRSETMDGSTPHHHGHTGSNASQPRVGKHKRNKSSKKSAAQFILNNRTLPPRPSSTRASRGHSGADIYDNGSDANNHHKTRPLNMSGSMHKGNDSGAATVTVGIDSEHLTLAGFVHGLEHGSASMNNLDQVNSASNLGDINNNGTYAGYNTNWDDSLANYEDDMDDDYDIDERFGRMSMSIWVKDEDVSHCYNCQLPFTFFRRRHHCRDCGKIFCGKCSQSRVSLTVGGQALRVCDLCFRRRGQVQI